MISPEIISAIQTLILAIIVLVTTFFIPQVKKLFQAWIDAKIKKIEDDSLRAKVEFGMKRLDFIVKNVVGEINQKKVSDSSTPTEEKELLFKEAFENIKSQITPETLSVLKTVVNNPGKYLKTKIEAEVGIAKLAKTTAECN